MKKIDPNFETITLAAGCFWGVEYLLSKQKGVIQTTCGYMGGTMENPTYRDICSGETGHAEVVQVQFDPKSTSLFTVLDFFWRIHDPTTLNRQGVDVGTQYRSAIFYHNEKQNKMAQISMEKLKKKNTFTGPIVTEIVPAQNFYPAEEYHQNYFNKNPNAQICHHIRK